MKTIQKSLLIIILLITTTAITAQDYTRSLQGIKTVKIGSATGITVKTHNNNQLLIKGLEKRKAPEKAKGLKAVYAAGNDNTGLGVSIKKEGEILVIKNLKSIHSEDLEVYLPKNINVSINNYSIGDILIEGFSSEIEVRSNAGEIDIIEVTGPIVAKTSAGDIRVIFNNVNQTSPISLISSAGDVDVSLPKNTPANLSLKSSIGEVYTDFELDYGKENDTMKIVGGNRSIKTQINNGGVAISLRSSAGNIYLRKK